TNLAGIRFEASKPISVVSKPTCRFRFSNDDELFGNLGSADADHVEVETWFGGNLKAPRRAVQSITLLAKGYSMLYEGPNGIVGWQFGRGPNSWQYRDGAFIANGIGALGRDVKLSGSASVEFDVAWTGQFNLIVVLYSEVFDQLDYNASSYMFYFGPGYVNVQRVQARSGVMS